MIPDKYIHEVLETAKVEEVVQDFVNLRKRGVNYLGLCPFHNEKSPSFSVSPVKNIYKCFGCGKAGNAAHFLMEHEQLTFYEAIRWLAKKYGIEIEEVQPSAAEIQLQHEEESLYLVNLFALQFYQKQLLETNKGRSIGLRYFKDRGFSDETVQNFGLGYASDEPDAFTLSATTAGYKKETLQKLGLTNQYDKDFFRARVMFPIHNLSGKIVGFGGRILIKDPKAPKYINTPETAVYTKSKLLYGIFQAKRSIRQIDECILVEGYTDVITLHQAGIDNSVASSGTSLTTEQIRLIKRYTSNVKIIFDGDSAGVKAALRGLDMLLEQDLNVKIVLLPENNDPDSYVKLVGPDDFKAYIKENANDFILFKTRILLSDAVKDPVKKAEAIKEIIKSIGKIPDPIKRSVFTKECAQLMEMQEALLIGEVNKIIAQDWKKKEWKDEQGRGAPHEEQPSAPSEPIWEDVTVSDEYQEKDLVRILIAGGENILEGTHEKSVGRYILENIEDILQEFDNQLYKRVVEEYGKMVRKGGLVNADYFIRHNDPAISQLAIHLLTSPFEYSENWEKKWNIFLQTQKMPEHNFKADSQSAVLRFRLRKILRMGQRNNEKIAELAKAGQLDQLTLHLKVQNKLNEMKKDLALKLGTVVLKR